MVPIVSNLTSWVLHRLSERPAQCNCMHLIGNAWLLQLVTVEVSGRRSMELHPLTASHCPQTVVARWCQQKDPSTNGITHEGQTAAQSQKCHFLEFNSSAIASKNNAPDDICFPNFKRLHSFYVLHSLWANLLLSETLKTMKCTCVHAIICALRHTQEWRTEICACKIGLLSWQNTRCTWLLLVFALV